MLSLLQTDYAEQIVNTFYEFTESTGDCSFIL